MGVQQEQNKEQELTDPEELKVLFFWVGDDSVIEDAHLRDWASTVGEVTDGSWYIRDSSSLENEDLDLLHDIEVLGRALVETIGAKLMDCGLNWRNVVLAGFGKGAGMILYAALLKLLPKPVAGIILFSPVVAFPSLLAEKLLSIRRGTPPPQTKTKVFTVWGSRNPSTPGSYRQLLAQALRKSPDVQVTPDTLPDGQNSLESGYLRVLPTLVQLCLPR